MEEEPESAINFISCLCFVQKGVAKENPEKVTLNQEELARIIGETRAAIEDATDEENAENENNMETASDSEQPPSNNIENDPDDEFNFNEYDNEESAQVAGIGDVVAIDPDHILDDEEDSEAEDDLIKPNDNLLLVGHIDDDAASLEVFVYNEDEGSFYVHHDFLLSSHPLCIEWLSYDLETKETGNMCAIGSMDPIVTIWDLDIQDTLEPVMKLGSKGSRKRNIQRYGHKQPVLDLSWNKEYPHILASASVDQSVILWDLDEGTPHTIISDFQEKVQSIQFHPTEPHSLLAGSCDGTIKLYDFRNQDQETYTSSSVWNVQGEVEHVIWDHPHDTYGCLASTNTGKIYYMDVRQNGSFVWSKQMHDQEVTGLKINPKCNGMLTTTSADGYLKIWKYNKTNAELMYSEDTRTGRVMCLGISPDNPFTIAVGGDNKRKNLKVINTKDYETVQRAFQLNN